MLTMEESLRKIVECMQSGDSRSSDLRGPPVKAPPDSLRRAGVDSQTGLSSKYPPKANISENLSRETPQAKPESFQRTVPSPAYEVPEDSVWNQSYLAKALQNMKETDFAKLKFSAQSNKPFEFEKWLVLMETTTHAQHQEIGLYWKRAVDSAEKAYSKYIQDVSYTRIGIAPEERPPLTMIEERIESR